jgi:hypothetical protein
MARSLVERLATKDITGRFDHETDSLYIEIAPGPSAETRAMANGLNVHSEADGNVIDFDTAKGIFRRCPHHLSSACLSGNLVKCQ